MAEAWTRELHPGRVEPFSAGTNPGRLDPRAVRVMAESGVDMSKQRAKHVEDLAGIPIDWVITVCDTAKEACPVYPGGARQAHAGFDDPPRLAARTADEEKALAPYRRVRDEIRAYIEGLPQLVAEPMTGSDTR